MIAKGNVIIKSPKETATTYLGNSSLKAKYFYKHSGLITISDDSGLSVNCLNGKPGIFSSRWAKKYGGFSNSIKVILERMKYKKNRSAQFVCSLSYKSPEGKIVVVVGKLNGKIFCLLEINLLK